MSGKGLECGPCKVGGGGGVEMVLMTCQSLLPVMPVHGRRCGQSVGLSQALHWGIGATPRSEENNFFYRGEGGGGSMGFSEGFPVANGK